MTGSPPPDDEAKAIYQAHLDAASDAVWRRDPNAIAAILDDSVDVVTGDERFLCVERGDSVDTLICFAGAMRSRGATAYHRLCIDARRVGPDEVEGSHTTYVLRGGNFVIDPYSCDLVLRRRAGAWVMSRTRVDRPFLGAAAFNPPRPRPAEAPRPAPAIQSEEIRK